MRSERKNILSRRDFLRLSTMLGGAAALSSLLDACARVGVDMPPVEELAQAADTAASTATETPTSTYTPKPTDTPPPTAADTPSPSATNTPLPTEVVSGAQVALVKTTDRAAGVRQAIELLGINPVAGMDVLLKPNFNSADPAPGSTHPDVLRSLVMKLQEMGAGKITVGDRSGMDLTNEVMRKLGVLEMAQELGFDTLIFDELALKQWVEIQTPEGHWKQGFLFAGPCLDCGALVQTCNLKTHRYGGVFTMSLKNSVGMVASNHRTTGYDYMGELHFSKHQLAMIAEINAAYAPALIVLDGVEAFVSGGPATGKRAAPEVVLAGTDRIAIDAVGVTLLRQHGATFKGSIFEQGQIARAVELGLGVDSAEKIEFITGDADSAAYAEQIMESMLSG